jgi:beta-1,4-mannosyltransferase
VTQTAAHHLTVLSNPGVWREGDNPFLKLLLESYDDSVQVEQFTWRKALGFRYDVLHVQWLEYLVRHDTPVKRAIKQALFAALLLRLTLVRTPSLWTVHNDTPHDVSGSWTERALLAAWSRRVTHKVFLTQAARSKAGSDAGSSVIVHGHYRPVLTQGAAPAPAHPRMEILHFGHLRPYKGIEALVEAFQQAWPEEEERPRLRIVGRAKDAEYGVALAAFVRGVPGVELTEAFVPDAELEAIIRSSDLVVLPYTKMYNSGAALLALSVGRPILVPASPTMIELQAEVGREWVHLFSPPFTADDLASVTAALQVAPQGLPDLTDRDWPVIGAAYSDLFRALAR